MARRLLQAAFDVPAECIAENGSLVPPQPPQVQIEHGTILHGPSNAELIATLPVGACGLYSLEIELGYGTLWLKMVRGIKGQGRETYMPVVGLCGLDPFAPPRGRACATKWLLPTGIAASHRAVVTLEPVAITREQGYSYKRAFAQAHSGVPAIDRQLCAGVVSQTTTYKVQCDTTTCSFRVTAHRERLDANPFGDFTLGLTE